jgi:alanyl-tRNA synthetase
MAICSCTSAIWSKGGRGPAPAGRLGSIALGGKAFACPHSATHILHYALPKNVRRHAQQQGSKVDEEICVAVRLRRSVGGCRPEQVQAVERDVKTQVAAAEPVSWKHVPLRRSRKAGAMMLFGEKYPRPGADWCRWAPSAANCAAARISITRARSGLLKWLWKRALPRARDRIVALTGAKAEAHARRVREMLEAGVRSSWAVRRSMFQPASKDLCSGCGRTGEPA